MAGLTDDEILQLEADQILSSGLTDEQLAAIESAGKEADDSKAPFVLDKILEKWIVPAGKAIDKYTGAPTRAAFTAPGKGKNILEEFFNQFGKEPEVADTGKEQAIRLGLSQTPASEKFTNLYSPEGSYAQLVPPFKKGGLLDVSPAGVAGLGLDVLEDWTNLVPGVLAGKAAAKAGAVTTGKTLNLAGKGIKAGAKATDAITGTKVASKVAGAGEAVADTAASAGKALVEMYDTVFNPRVSMLWSEAEDLAKRFNIDPNTLSPAIKYGPTSAISRIQRALAEGIKGEDLLNLHEEGFRQIRDALNDKIKTIGYGTVLDEKEAGALIKESFYKRTEELFNKLDSTYNKIAKANPGLMITDYDKFIIDTALFELEQKAKKMVETGITNTTRGQGEQLLRAVENARNAKGSFADTVAQMQEIGRISYGRNQNALADVPLDIQRFKDLYQELKRAVLHTVKVKVGENEFVDLVNNNKIMTDYFSNKNAVAGAIGSSKLSDEGIFRNLVKGGDTKKIRALMNILGDQELAALKAAYLNSLIKFNADGTFSFDTLYSALRTNKAKLKEIFKDANLFSFYDLIDVADLIKLGKEHGFGKMSTSGSSAGWSLTDIPKAITRATVDENILNRMKARADKLGPPTTSTSKPRFGVNPFGDEVGAVSLDLPKELLKGIMKSKRGPIERRSKVFQSVAPSMYTEKDKKRLRLKALE